MNLNLGSIPIPEVDSKGLLVGSWFSGITWTILAAQAISYATSFPNDHLLLKMAVAVLFLGETTLSILFFVLTYRHLLLVAPGSLESLLPSMIMLCMPYLIWFDVGIINAFLIWRYSRLTKRRVLSYCLYALALGGLACHLWATSLGIKSRKPSLADYVNADPGLYTQVYDGAKAGLSIEVGIVCLIWLLMLVQLLSLLRRDMQDARQLVLRLVLVTVESGTMAAAIAIGTLVYYLRNPFSYNLIVWTAFMCRTYYMGMLFNLNFRSSGGKVMQESAATRSRVTGGISGTTSIIRPSPADENIVFPPRIIQVSQSIATKVDEDSDNIEKGYC